MDQPGTFVIALSGLVIALISLGWNVYLHVVSKAKVKVTARIVDVYSEGSGKTSSNVVALQAVNLRSRPVTLLGFYGTYLNRRPNIWIKGSSPLPGSRFPCEIKEGEVASQMIPLSSLEDAHNIKYVFASDTTGREWLSKKRPLFRQVEKMRKPEGLVK